VVGSKTLAMALQRIRSHQKCMSPMIPTLNACIHIIEFTKSLIICLISL